MRPDLLAEASVHREHKRANLFIYFGIAFNV